MNHEQVLKQEAEESILLSIQYADQSMETIIIPTIQYINVMTDPERDSYRAIFPVEVGDHPRLKNDLQLQAVFFNATNDPTPDRANGVISLGYYSLKFSFKHPKVISLNPLIIEGKNDEDAVFTKLTRPSRRVTP